MYTLNDIIAHILGTHKGTLRDLWLQHSPIPETEGYPTDVRKVNHFLRIQLGLLPFDTCRLRECLTNEPVQADWVSGFEEEIAPVISRFGLPCWSDPI